MKKKFMFCALALAMLLLFSACGSEEPKTQNTGDLQKVTVVLDYVPNTNHTGLYAAKDLGYYEAEGLDVDIIEPAENAVTTLIATGKGDFGISFQEDVTYALTAEDPLPVKAIATIIQHNTSGFASYKGKNILRPKDFAGKTYAGWGAPSEEAVINAVMKEDGGDFSQLNIVVSDGSGYEALKDDVDIIWLFWAWDGIAAERAGMPINYLELRQLDKRLDYYTPVIITSDDIIKNNPDLAAKFMAATKKGYEYCIENPDGAAEIIHKYASTYDLDMLKASQEYLAGKYSEDTDTWGVMKDEVWDSYTDFMKENGLINKDIAASDCYTNEFLK